MPRNGSGVYSLPAGNPVVAGTTIATTWANPTLSDIAQALTDSLDRNGLGGMLVAFKISDGSLGAPGLAFTNEAGLGAYRSGSGVMNFVSDGVVYFTVGTDKVVSPVKAEFRGLSTYKLTGSKNWRLDNQAGALVLTPSATINAEDWDTAKDTFFNADGTVTLSGNLTVPTVTVSGVATLGSISSGAITSSGAIGGTAISGTSMTSTGAVTAKQHTQTQNVANITGSVNVDYDTAQSHILTLTGAAVITPINVPVGSIIRITLAATNLGVTWAASVKWAGGGAAPDLAAGTLKRAVCVLEWDGTYFLGSAGAY